MEGSTCSKRTRTRTCKEKNQKNTSLITLLPEDILMDCIARVPKQNYLSISQVCKLFRYIVTSSELYTRRSLLGCTEYCIYVSIQLDNKNQNMRWFTIHNKRLILIRSLPPMPYSCLGKSYVVLGSRIFVLGGYYNAKIAYDVYAIDCRFDIAESIGTTYASDPVCNVVDGKIYVMGARGWSWHKMMVLDTEPKTWECKSSGIEAGRAMISSVSMDDKIYIMGMKNNRFVFEPKESKCEEEEVSGEELVHYNNCRWESGCVIDGILYCYDTFDRCLREYDLKHRFCGVVKGVEVLTNRSCYDVCLSSCGGKKIILLMQTGQSSEIWGAEISLKERNEKGEIWGNVVWCQLLLDGGYGYTLTNCLTVVV